MPQDLDRAEDHAFDTIYPSAIRRLSRRFWTPVGVAHRAAELLRDAGVRRVLDVGAGVGKFVLAAAAAAPGLRFVGVEQRPHLVDVARRSQVQLGIPNATFVVGPLTSVRWRRFDAFYFFNPLAENLHAEADRIDSLVELTRSRFVRDAWLVETALRNARLGTVVVTYYGTSTRIPDSYDVTVAERAGSDWLRVWVKNRAKDHGAFFLELDDSIVWHPAAKGMA